jgi:hypothetical protein
VFQGWLKSGGDPAVLRDSLRCWMRVHGESPSAKYVRRAWAGAGAGSSVPSQASRRF